MNRLLWSKERLHFIYAKNSLKIQWERLFALVLIALKDFYLLGKKWIFSSCSIFFKKLFFSEGLLASGKFWVLKYCVSKLTSEPTEVSWVLPLKSAEAGFCLLFGKHCLQQSDSNLCWHLAEKTQTTQLSQHTTAASSACTDTRVLWPKPGKCSEIVCAQISRNHMAKPFLDFKLRAITPLYFPLQ